MQTRELIEKIRWIHALASDDLQKWMFPSFGDRDPREVNVVGMIHDATRFAETAARDESAVEVLYAFGLGFLTNRDEFGKWLDSHVTGGARRYESREEEEPKRMRQDPTSSETTAWRSMIRSVDPIERLTIPEEMRKHDLPETFISFELASITDENPPLSRLSKATAFAEEAYEAVMQAYAIQGSSRLTVVKVESGSGIRIDCKGLGEPVKHLKDLILESWHKLRHKRAEEVLENNKAVLESLAVIEQINMKERDKSLSGEEAEQLRRKVVRSVSGLFESGALIAEIPPEETVENTKLLGGFVPKRLAPPVNGGNTQTRRATRKKTAPKKRSSPRRKA